MSKRTRPDLSGEIVTFFLETTKIKFQLRFNKAKTVRDVF